MRLAPAIAARQHGIFTFAQAVSDGWTKAALEHAVRLGVIRRIRRGVYAGPAVVTGDRYADARAEHRVHTIAALLAMPRAAASHESGSMMWGLPTLEIPRLPHITVPPGYTGDTSGVHLHRAGHARAGEVWLISGQWRTLSAARCAFDCSRRGGLAAGLVVADDVLRRGLATRADLAAVVAAYSHWSGAATARQVVEFADPRSESALESVSRLCMAQHNLPAPEPQVTLCIDGEDVRRVDFYWDEYGVAGEADGWDKYEKNRGLMRDEAKAIERLRDLGVLFVRWDSADTRRFGPVAGRLQHNFARGLLRDERRWTVRPSGLLVAA